MYSDLIIAVDISKDRKRYIIGIVSGLEHRPKTPEFLSRTSWIRHYREIPSKRQKSYLHASTKT